MKLPGENLLAAIRLWSNALDHYSLTQLTLVPSPGSWSIGQLYMHLITNTQFFIEQAQICLQSGNNQSEVHSPQAAKMFSENGFPDLRIEGPPSNADTRQPGSKDELERGLSHLSKMTVEITGSFPTKQVSGKTRHPGLGFFNANEWLVFAEMHLRHHLRQKNRLDKYLNDIGNG